jgi:hypothetical protein
MEKCCSLLSVYSLIGTGQTLFVRFQKIKNFTFLKLEAI